MGGLETEVDDDTREIALEAAHFAPRAVARMSRRHKLSSEASRRFERGVDHVLAPYASARAAALLLEHGGGQYVGMTAVEAAHEPVRHRARRRPPGARRRHPGAARDGRRPAARRRRGGRRPGGRRARVTPPSWRPDLTDPADLVEEVLRLGGYDAIPATLPPARAGFGLTEAQRARRRVGRALAGAGLRRGAVLPVRRRGRARRAGSAGRRRRVGACCCSRTRSPTSSPACAATLLPGPARDAAPQRRARHHRRGRLRGGRGRAAARLAAAARGHRPAAPGGRRRARPTTSSPGSRRCCPTSRRTSRSRCPALRSPSGWWGAGETATWADAIEAARVVADAVGAEIVVRRGAPLRRGTPAAAPRSWR